MARRRRTPLRWLIRFRRFIRNDQLVLSVLAVVVGAAAAFGTVLMRLAISALHDTFFGTDGGSLIAAVAEAPWWQVLIVPSFGGLVIGLFIYYIMPDRRHQGVAAVIEASALRGGRMSFRAGLGAALASIGSIGVGASVGREGPAVHLGATIGSQIARRLHLTRSMSRCLLGCGVAAAVAASFNAPIAGALFAHEVVIGHFAISAFAPIVIASVVGTIISRIFFGNFPAFEILENPLVSYLEFPAVVGLGLLCGAVAVIFMRATMFTEDQFQKVPGPQWVRPGIAGFLVGLIALVFPQVMGVGYDATDLALKVEYSLALLIVLVMAKTAATAISVGGGFGGGMFTPALMIGAMLGGGYGLIATDVFPHQSSGPSAYTIVGMGGVAAAVMGAPISTVLIIFEMTDDYSLTIAVMVAVVIASLISNQFARGSFFNWQLERAGYDLKHGFETALLRSILVRQIMKQAGETVDIGTGLQDVRQKLQHSEIGELFVLRNETELFGTITLADLSDIAFDHDVDNLINAGDVARTHPPVLDATDNLEVANRVFRESGEHYIAVVENHDNMIYVGTLYEADVLAAYNRALVETRREEHEGHL